ncbi:hypothetical protein DOM22_12165 [Bdellovibrio sp. ZAP7]|nr:hypothetical protein DOM22_12165 [Bdellovibrio sp. ZAP7]
MDALEGDEGHGRPADTLKQENDLKKEVRIYGIKRSCNVLPLLLRSCHVHPVAHGGSKARTSEIFAEIKLFCGS